MKSEEEIRHTIASNLSFYRKLNNMTQAQVADLLSYSDKAISKWERGEAAPDIYILTAFAEIYHVSVNDLLSEKKLKEEIQRQKEEERKKKKELQEEIEKVYKTLVKSWTTYLELLEEANYIVDSIEEKAILFVEIIDEAERQKKNTARS